MIEDAVPADVNCPLCGGLRASVTSRQPGYRTLRCGRCGLTQRLPFARGADAARNRPAAVNCNCAVRRESLERWPELARRLAQQRLREIRRVVPADGRWLEIAPAGGAFLDVARGQGIDIVPWQWPHSEPTVDVPLSDGATPSARQWPVGKQFDCIVALGILEQVQDPLEFVRQLSQHVRPGGFAVVTACNCNGWPGYLLGRHAWSDATDDRLNSFELRTLSQLGASFGLATQRTCRTASLVDLESSLASVERAHPWFQRMVAAAGRLLPRSIRRRPLKVPCSELLWVGHKTVADQLVPDRCPALQPLAIS